MEFKTAMSARQLVLTIAFGVGLGIFGGFIVTSLAISAYNAAVAPPEASAEYQGLDQ